MGKKRKIMKRLGSSIAMGAVGLLLSSAVAGSDARANTFDTGSTGGSQAHNNHQPGLGINYLVALQGLYPSRSADTGDITPSGGEPYIGEITMFGGNFAPRGYAFANGQLLSIAGNDALFSLYGTTYGGDGRTTFALPDLRGRSAMHQGNGPGLSSYWLGQKGGSDTSTLSIANLPSHSHTVSGYPDTSSVGGNVAHSNLKPYQAINFNIVTQGIYPSRNADTGDISPSSANPQLAFVQMFGGNYAPRTTLATDGQILSISQNTALFSLLGTTFGGDGRTTFALPDLRGRLVMGTGQGPGLEFRSIGEKDGVEFVTLGVNNLPGHTHTADPWAPETIGSTGGNQTHENMQPTNTLNYIIALNGLFPSRSADEGDILPSEADPFIGEIAMFAGNFAPRGWAMCEGQLLPISQFQALFSILGTTYGGDGRTTFALPDLRGRVPVHVGGNSGQGPGLMPWSLGQKFGEEDHLLTLGEMPAHDHNYVPEPTTGLLCLLGMAGLVSRRRR